MLLIKKITIFLTTALFYLLCISLPIIASYCSPPPEFTVILYGQVTAITADSATTLYTISYNSARHSDTQQEFEPIIITYQVNNNSINKAPLALGDQVYLATKKYPQNDPEAINTTITRLRKDNNIWPQVKKYPQPK